MREGGFSANELKACGYTALELKKGGYTDKKIIAAKYPKQVLKKQKLEYLFSIKITNLRLN